MADMDNVLVVLGDDREQAVYVLEKASALARASGASLHAVRVVYEGIADLPAAAIDAAADLKTFILESEESVTDEMLDRARRDGVTVDSVTLWNKRPWEGVIHAAEACGADLIVRAATLHQRFGEVIRTPDDWSLLRSARVPVMLVKPDAWVPEPTVLCALDPFDDGHGPLNRALLRQAESLTRVLGGALDLVAAYPLFERWVDNIGGLRDYDEIRREVEAEMLQRIHALVEDAGIAYRRVLVDEGYPAQVIGTLAEQSGAELVVVGTHARGGVSGMLLGNTSERLVHHLTTDVLTVPSPDNG